MCGWHKGVPNHSPTEIRTVSLVILSPSAEQGKALSHAPDSFTDVARRQAVVLEVSALRKGSPIELQHVADPMISGNGTRGAMVDLYQLSHSPSKQPRLHHDQGTHWSLCCLGVAGERQYRLHQLRLRKQTVQDEQHSLYPNLYFPLVMMLVTRLDHHAV